MKNYVKLILILTLTSYHSTAQENSLVIVDEVTVLNSNEDEALYYYQQNWAKAREIAKERGYIQDFFLLQNDQKPESLLLITILKNESQKESLEENFRKVFQAMPPGPKLLNRKKPNEFREVSTLRFTNVTTP
ncbi:hypothetical protein [Jiulongibacter sediminis]|uniref:hypothetical protein n=1 Tax=Jiulongibacter sediminis TaxID=1605367 RepID=UPI0006DBF64A|nr:hypothetical protein [Jiulongibacter sediminis]